MDSVRSFLVCWALVTVAVLGYAVIDLRMHPELRDETVFSMTPDLDQIGPQMASLPHWGGRLLKERAIGLLVCNALALGGFIALGSGFVVARVRRHRVESPP
jgi:hypothetical protein